MFQILLLINSFNTTNYNEVIKLTTQDKNIINQDTYPLNKILIFEEN